MPDLKSMTLAELKEIAKSHNIKNISKLKKEELIIILSQLFKTENKEEVTNNEEIDENLNEENEANEVKKEPAERHYDENGNPIVDYKLTNEGDMIAEGILDILPDGYGFLRGENYLSSEKDVYISMVQIRRFRLDNGDVIKGIARCREGEKFPSLIFVGEVNGEHPEKAMKRKRFDELIPIFPRKIKIRNNSK